MKRRCINVAKYFFLEKLKFDDQNATLFLSFTIKTFWALLIVIFGQKWPQVFLLAYYNTYYALQVLCTIGKLKEIPNDFPLETEEITISNQDIRTIPANGTHSYSN